MRLCEEVCTGLRELTDADSMLGTAADDSATAVTADAPERVRLREAGGSTAEETSPPPTRDLEISTLREEVGNRVPGCADAATVLETAAEVEETTATTGLPEDWRPRESAEPPESRTCCSYILCRVFIAALNSSGIRFFA